MMHFLTSYLKFLWSSSNAHGVHSPFVFDLATKCFYEKQPYPEYALLEKHRKTLLNNDGLITVDDFGAGSKIFKSNTRKISAIARNAGISKDCAALLFRMVRYFGPKTILEIGTSLGLATAAMHLGNTNTRIDTVEGCRETSTVAKNHFDKAGFSISEFIVSEFENYLEKISGNTYDLIYFDGNHTKEATLKYFDLLFPTVTNETVWIFDDIHWSTEMEAAWEVITQNQQVTISIDIFKWGLVFFRKEQAKEHFIIRV